MSKKPSLNDLLNQQNFLELFNFFKGICLNMFQWDGLPESILPEYIEEPLFDRGIVGFFQDEKNGLLCLPAQGEGGVNVYGEYTDFRITGQNGYNVVVSIDNCTPIYNRIDRTNSRDLVLIYVNRLVNIERTIDVNVNHQKTPKIILCDDKDRLTFLNIIKQADDNEPAIYADKNLNINNVDSLDITAPYVSDKLMDLWHDTVNELLTMLGINNANTDKRERLVTDEVNSNNEIIDKAADLYLIARQRAVDKINKKFNLSISVKRRGYDDGGLHNDDKGNN